MRNAVRMVVALLPALWASGVAWGGEGSAPPARCCVFYSLHVDEAGPRRASVSSVAPIPTDAARDRLTSGYGKLLVIRFGADARGLGEPLCKMHASAADADAFRTKLIANLRGKGYEVVEVPCSGNPELDVEAERAWPAVVAEDTEAAYTIFLNRFGATQRGDEARARLKKLATKRGEVEEKLARALAVGGATDLRSRYHVVVCAGTGSGRQRRAWLSSVVERRPGQSVDGLCTGFAWLLKGRFPQFAGRMSRPAAKASHASPREAKRYRQLIVARLRQEGYTVEDVEFGGVRSLRNPRGSIQRVVDESSPGTTVIIGRGEYRQAVALKSGITLVGADRQASIVRGSEGDALLSAVDCTDVAIMNLVFDGATTASGGRVGLKLEGSNVVVSGCTVRACGGGGIVVSGREARGTLRNNVCRGNRSGITIRDGARVTAQGNTCRDNTANGIEADGRDTSVTVQGNTCSGNRTHGIRFGAGACGSATRNTCSANSDSGLAVLDSGTAPTLDGNTCRSNRRYGIYLTDGAGGTASRNTCEANRSGGVRLTGEDTHVTVIENVCRANLGAGIYCSASLRARVERNLCASNSRSGIDVRGTGANFALRRNHCEENKYSGIYFGSRASGACEDNTCIRNQQSGIYIHGTGTAPRVIGNRCWRNKQNGIRLRSGASAVLQKNSCQGNMNSGISVWDKGTGPVVRSSVCRANKVNGIVIGGGAGGTFDGNTCELNKGTGIAVFDAGASPVVKGNTCRHNKCHGIYFGKGACGTATGNTCEYNIWSGIAVKDKGSCPVLGSNRCRRNTNYGINAWSGGEPRLLQGNSCQDNGLGDIRR